MAIRKYGVALGAGQPVAEGPFVLTTEVAAVQTKIDLAAANATISGNGTALGLVNDITTVNALVGASLGSAAITVIANDSGLTKAKLVTALEAVVAHVRESSAF